MFVLRLATSHSAFGFERLRLETSWFPPRCFAAPDIFSSPGKASSTPPESHKVTRRTRAAVGGAHGRGLAPSQALRPLRRQGEREPPGSDVHIWWMSGCHGFCLWPVSPRF